MLCTCQPLASRSSLNPCICRAECRVGTGFLSAFLDNVRPAPSPAHLLPRQPCALHAIWQLPAAAPGWLPAALPWPKASTIVRLPCMQVTTMLLIAPVSISVMRQCNQDPVPLLISMVGARREPPGLHPQVLQVACPVCQCGSSACSTSSQLGTWGVRGVQSRVPDGQCAPHRRS